MADQPWWQTAVVYQVYPRSFADTNGDGVGDLAGVTAHLDHLVRLGVDAIWLSPFYPSPMADFGYDVTDHTGVDPLFGDVADAERLIAEAHRRGIRVLVDFVPNHTSDQHPWFTESRSSRENPRRDWYLWAGPAPDGGPPNNWLSVFGGSAWTLDPATSQYYYHAYLAAQPDLNWRNPDVRTAQHDVMRCWLDRGVDGFRVDASRQLVKDALLRDNPPNPDYHPDLPPYDSLLPVHTTDRPEVLELLTGMRSVLDERRPDGVLLAEMYLPVERLAHYYGRNGDGVHLPSNMHLISTPYTAEAIGALVARYEAVLPAGAWPNWVLGNHDRSRVATRLGPAQARVAAMLLLTLRGTPIVYYGDEIGMTDVPVIDEQDPFAKLVPGLGVGRDPERAPMRWTPETHCGFCPPDVTPWLPIPETERAVNVETQDGDPNSMLTLYRSLIALRRSEPALTSGSYAQLCASDGVLAYRRAHVLVALNLTDEPRSVPASGVVRVGTHADRVGERVGPVLTLRADEGVVL
ncbi:MAG TPA: alpha-amylase family glycosyl hydrolase [Pseudonocardiaceae bacterium]|nr:alpha-amylase family glycosyl hydrolase [Pseudonocardiaceae bacterium]